LVLELLWYKLSRFGGDCKNVRFLSHEL